MAKHKTSNRAVVMYSIDGDLLGIFDSIREAAERSGVKYGMVWNVLNGIRKSAHGYVFKYADED